MTGVTLWNNPSGSKPAEIPRVMLTDHLGSVDMVVNYDNSVSAQESFDVFSHGHVHLLQIDTATEYGSGGVKCCLDALLPGGGTLLVLARSFENYVIGDKMESEWSMPHESVPVRQGDLLVSRDPATMLVEEIVLVITADCDISKGKFGKQLSCLRVVPLKAYIRTHWSERKLTAAFDAESRSQRERLAKLHSVATGEQSRLTVNGTIEWVRSTEPGIICDQLKMEDKKERNKLIKLLAPFKAAIHAKEQPGADPFQCFVGYRAALLERSIEETKIQVVKSAQADTFPDDVFHLSQVPQVDCGSAIVLLRELVGVRLEDVRFKARDASSTSLYLRVGRLQPTFKYAVSQSYGTLYSRIGLPGDYEERCKAAIDGLHEQAWD